MNYLTYGGRSTKEFNVWISGTGTFNAPERDYTKEEIVGRNGDLTFDNGRYKNIEITYPAFISQDLMEHIADFEAYMLSLVGYQRLEDTYHPEVYRMAALKGGLDITTTARNLAGQFDLTFDCKPQKFLKAGEKAINVTETKIIRNTTLYEAKPLIRAYGTGSFAINGVTCTITAADVYTDIDCELMDAYKIVNGVAVNKNAYVNIPVYPTLKNGNNTVTVSGVTLDIYPRWWTI